MEIPEFRAQSPALANRLWIRLRQEPVRLSELLRLEEISSYKIIYSGLARHYRNGHNVLILLVGAVRFELTTPCAQGRCATGLRYAPTLKLLLSF